ncbi:hypothetical protein BBJ28_00005021 [Nothophytophthora sp. Chile5]|nr:hypothetical protein BBJ28_00005021 [Nothophytophthora sp. Chile5]
MVLSIVRSPDMLLLMHVVSSQNRGSRPNSLEKKYVTTVPTRKGDLELKKLNYVRKFEEPDRVVIVWGDLILVPQHQLQFRVQSWMAITRSEADPLQGCVARSFLQIFAEPQGDLECKLDEDIVAALFALLGDIFRQHFQAEQNMMIREAEEIMEVLADDEAMATLEEVVAFIDACDGDHHSAGDATTSGSEGGGSPFVNVDANSGILDALDSTLDTTSFLQNQEPETQTPSLPSQENKKKRKASGSSTQLQ